MSSAPARIAGLEAPSLAAGATADFCIVDPAAVWTVTPEALQSRSWNSPWPGRADRQGPPYGGRRARRLGRPCLSPAVIVLEDGATFAGEALAGSGSVGGEIVFNTSMCGYQEIATDPSYCGQLITYTFPMNGDYGADADRDESGKAHARAIIARELASTTASTAPRARRGWTGWPSTASWP